MPNEDGNTTAPGSIEHREMPVCQRHALDMVDGLVESLENQAIIAQATEIVTTTEQQSSEDALERLRTLALTERPLPADGGGVGHRRA